MKCICCGADESSFITDSSGVLYCPYCGNEINNNSSNRNISLIIEKACQLREDFQFEKAFNLTNKLLLSDPINPTYNWYALLSDYKVTYINNGNGQEPTFLETNRSPIQESKYYTYLSERRKNVADRLEEYRLGYQAQNDKVKRYDVFISYKKHMIDDPTRETTEAKWANQLYHYLDKLGYKVFYDSECLYKSNVEWEPHIYGALKSAKMMIICGSKIENIESTWVKNEWKRFLAYKRADETKTICILGLNINPGLLSDPELRLNQMVNADDGNWLQTLEERVKDACKINTKVQKKKLTKIMYKDNVIELSDTYERTKDKDLDTINNLLENPRKRAGAIKKFNQIYSYSYSTNTISSKELAINAAISYELPSINSLFTMETFNKLPNKIVYSQMLACNDNKAFLTKVIDFLYDAICENYNQADIAKLFLDVIGFNHKGRAAFIDKLYPLVLKSTNAYQIFDKLLLIKNQSLEEDTKTLLDYANVCLSNERYDLATKYATAILGQCDRESFKAAEIKFLAVNRSNSYEMCFSFKKILDANSINLTSLNTLLDLLGTTKVICKKCDYKLARLPGSSTYCCLRCGNKEVKKEQPNDSISLLDSIIDSIVNGIVDPKSNANPNHDRMYQGIEFINSSYTSTIDKILAFYPEEERKFRYLYVATKLHEKRLFKPAINYYKKSFDCKQKSESEIYLSLILCDCLATNADELIKSNRLITKSIYYNKIEMYLQPGSDESKRFIELVNKQQRANGLSAAAANIAAPAPKIYKEKKKKAPLAIKKLKRKVILNRLFNLIFLAIFFYINTKLYDLLLVYDEQYAFISLFVSGFVLFEILISFMKNRIINRKFFGILFRLITIAYLIAGFAFIIL